MSSPPVESDIPPEIIGKKRKRTGKEREERKKAAIQAALEAQSQEEVLLAGDGVKQELNAVVGDDAALDVEGEKQAKVGIDEEKAAKRIPQALKSLHPVFKQAKSFETRRLIKKIKFLRSKSGDKTELSDLEAQLQLLHAVQLHPLAQSHLLLRLRKHPLLKHAPLPKSLADPLTPSIPSIPTTSTSATPALVGKVENRLCSAKSVADAVKNVVSWVLGQEGAKLVVGVKVAKVEKKQSMNPARAARLAAASDVGDDSADEGEGSQSGEEDDLVPRLLAEGESDADAGSDDEVVQQDFAADAAGWESGSLSGGDGEFDEDDDGGEDSDDSDAISLPQPKRSRPSASTISTSLKTDSKSGKAEKAAKATKPDKSSKRTDITSSLFLPSLATGFTRGDDGDSDPDMDYDPDGVIGTQKAERKNRRGQRARQAIWEKKFGKGAKHVVKARQEEESQREKAAKARQDREYAKKLGRDAGWGSKSGNGVGSGDGPVKETVTTGDIGAAVGSGRLATGKATAPSYSHTPVPASTADTLKPALHPSWEAARLRKQKMGMVPAGQAAKPNKIIFD